MDINCSSFRVLMGSGGRARQHGEDGPVLSLLLLIEAPLDIEAKQKDIIVYPDTNGCSCTKWGAEGMLF